MTARAVPNMDVALRLLLVEDDAGYAGFIGATLMGAASARFQYDHVSSIRSALAWILNGVRAPKRSTSDANASTQPGLSPKMSSANQTWSGRAALRTKASSDATLAAERDW